MTTANCKKDFDDGLVRLLHDLESNKTLCRVKDYPGVSLKQLNNHVNKHGPLVHPVLGEQPAFFIDEGHFTPYRMVVYGREKVAFKIAELLGEWAKWSGEGGRGTTSQGAFILERSTGTPTVRMPDVAYTPREVDRQLSPQQSWTYGGEPFVPSFVVEIDKLAGRGSQRRALDRKMRSEYFQHGVQLGWLIDPHPDHQIMYEYKVNANGDVDCDGITAWRDLDGGDVLPGFILRCEDLDDVLVQDSGSSSEEEVDLVCPERGCTERFYRRGAFTAHTEWHRVASARARRRANRANH